MLAVLATGLAAVTVVAATAGLRWRGKLWMLAGFTGLCAAAVLALALLEGNEPQLVLPLGLSYLMLGIVVRGAREQGSDTAGSELQSHLARCRRRGENASALVVALSRPVGKDAAEALRITDSAVIRRVGKCWELHAILDNDDVPRRIIEERLAVAMAGSDPAFGWASFPADGFTLEALFEHARTEIGRAVPAAPGRRVDDASRAPDDPTPAT